MGSEPRPVAPADLEIARLLRGLTAQRAAAKLRSHVAALDDLIEQIEQIDARHARRREAADGA